MLIREGKKNQFHFLLEWTKALPLHFQTPNECRRSGSDRDLVPGESAVVPVPSLFLLPSFQPPGF